jgi:hypothetical protein
MYYGANRIVTIAPNNLRFYICCDKKYRNNFYSKSFLLGFLEASLDKKPKVNKEIKKLTTV